MDNPNKEIREREKQAFKPWLKFSIGDTVYLKSDIKKTTPLTVFAYIFDDGIDYKVVWINRKGIAESMRINEYVITY